MAKFRKKPVVIEAIQWDGTNIKELKQMESPSEFWFGGMDRETGDLGIYTLEGLVTARIGDWVIRGVQGELYPCKPDIFAATYEPALEER